MPMISAEWGQLNKFPWEAIFKCGQMYRQANPSHNNQYYQEYMLDTWGIDHGTDHICVVDEQKYMMFLLRFS